MSLNDSDKPVEHYERSLDCLQFCQCILSIYLSIPTTLPPFTWVTINCYINCKVVLFPIPNAGPQRGLNHGLLDPQSPALLSELSAADFVINFLSSCLKAKRTQNLFYHFDLADFKAVQYSCQHQRYKLVKSKLL